MGVDTGGTVVYDSPDEVFIVPIPYAAAVSYKRDAAGAFTRNADNRLEERDLDRSQGSGGNLGEFTTRDAAIDCARAYVTSIGVP